MEQFSVIGLWNAMGPLAKLVSMFLVGMSVWSFAVAIERYIVFRNAKKRSMAFAPVVSEHLRNLDLTKALEVCSTALQENKNNPLASIVQSGLQEFQVSEETGEPMALEIDAVRQSLAGSLSIVNANLKRGLGGLATIGSTAPFVGLFGTVIGIINAFRGIAMSGTGGIGSVSAGIAEALVTTAFGLFVAIPAVWLFNYFTNKLETFSVELDHSASELIGHFLKREARVKTERGA